MNKKNVNSDLRLRIGKYLKYVWKEEENFINEEANMVISELSNSLKNELLLEANGRFLKNMNFFSKNFNEETLISTLPIIKEQRYM